MRTVTGEGSREHTVAYLVEIQQHRFALFPAKVLEIDLVHREEEVRVAEQTVDYRGQITRHGESRRVKCR